MILSDQEIQRLSSSGAPLVKPFSPQSLRLSSYDLTVGEEYYDGAKGKSNTIRTEALLPSQSFTIPPHGICFVLAAETITLPNDVTAKVSLRMSLVYLGLVMTAQPPFDPGYSGKVIVMVHNLSSQPHHLQRGSRMATIEFSRVSNLMPANNPPAHRSVVDLVGQLTSPITGSLVDIASSAATAKRRVAQLAVTMIGFAALLLAVSIVPGWYSYSIFTDRQNEQRARIDEVNKSAAEEKLAMEALRQQLSKTVDEQKLLLEDLRRKVSDVQSRIEAKSAAVGDSASNVRK